MTQALEAWSGTAPLPRFCFVNCTLTDAAFHQGGPYSEIATASVRDSDARMGRVLDAVERASAWDRTAFSSSPTTAWRTATRRSRVIGRTH
jgi:hypothetical protein